MRHRILWAKSVWEVFEELPERDREKILAHLKYLERYPHMYPARTKSRWFRRHRWFQAGHWIVYYRVTSGTVYVRGIWPARIPWCNDFEITPERNVKVAKLANSDGVM